MKKVYNTGEAERALRMAMRRRASLSDIDKAKLDDYVDFCISTKTLPTFVGWSKLSIAYFNKAYKKAARATVKREPKCTHPSVILVCEHCGKKVM